MKVTDPKQVTAILKECSLDHESVGALASGGFRVNVVHGMYDSASWTYDNIAKAAALLGTTDISFEWESG